MYKFVDTVATGGQSALLSLQTIFNGNNLDELLTDENGRFVTLSVGGRGVLPRRIDSYETPYRHGAREKSYTYDVREIPVNFLIEDKTNEGFRERFERLNGLLLGSQKRLEFTDENAYFVATLQSGDTPDEESNSQQGTLLFVCTDPSKRKDEKVLSVGTTSQQHEITGQESTPWTIEVNFTENRNRFEFWAGDNYLQLNYNFITGDKLIVEYTGRKVRLRDMDLRRTISISSNFKKLEPGPVSIRASHACTLKYTERYY